MHYKPLHLHKVVSGMNESEYPVADKEWKRLITLPCHPAMTDDDIDYVVYWIKQYFSGIFQKKPWS